MTSLQLVRSAHAMRWALLFSSLFTVALAVALGIFLPNHPWRSVLLGTAVSLVMFTVSLFTTRRTALADRPGLGWIALDFLIKIILIGVTLFFARSVSGFEVRVIAIVVVVGLLANVVAQAVVFAWRSGRDLHT